MRQPTSEISGLLLDIALLLDASETDGIEDKPYLPVAEKTYLVGVPCFWFLYIVPRKLCRSFGLQVSVAEPPENLPLSGNIDGNRHEDP